MSADVLHPFDIHVGRIRAALRGMDRTGRQLRPDERVVPGLYVSWGGGGGEARITATASDTALLQIAAEVTGDLEWFTLNIELGPGQLNPGDVLGLALAGSTGAAGLDLAGFLLSARLPGGGVGETALADRLVLGPDSAAGLALHILEPGEAATRAQEFHTLVLNLPRRNFEIALRDLRVFVQPAGAGYARRTPTLAQAFG